MQYFIHAPSERKTVLISLELEPNTFNGTVIDFIESGLATIPATSQTAHVHPKDNYSKAIGRAVARSAPEVTELYTIKAIGLQKEHTTLTLYRLGGEGPGDTLYVRKYNDSKKVCIFTVDNAYLMG